MRKLLTITLMMVFAVTLLSACTKKNEEVKKEEINMRYISFGSGDKTMVIIPGLSTGYVTDSKEAIEGAFASFKDDYTVYLFDIRDDVPENYTIQQMGDDLVNKFNEFGLKDVYLYGCSMGGMQSLYIAGKYPDLVSKVCVCSSACKANDTSNEVINHWIDLAKDKKTEELSHSMGQLIYSKGLYEANKEYFSELAKGYSDDILQRFILTASAIPDFDISLEASKIRCPILVLGALGDQILTSDASKQIADTTHGELYLYDEEASHAIYDEASDLKDRVKTFFDQ